MADLILRNVPGWGDITIRDSWPQSIKDMWISALGELFNQYAPSSGPFVPTFESQQFEQQDPTVPSAPLSVTDFATKETADELAKRFDATVALVALPYTTGKQRWLVWPDGTAIIAGVLAAYYQNSPEDQFPGVAQKQVERGIADARAAGQKLPA